MDASTICRRQREEGSQMLLSHSKCRCRNPEGAQTSPANSLNKSHCSPAMWYSVMRERTLFLRYHPWASITESYLIKKHAEQMSKTILCIQTRKSLFFKSSEGLRHIPSKPLRLQTRKLSHREWKLLTSGHEACLCQNWNSSTLLDYSFLLIAKSN